jgi:cell fate regulator YaaT (PSP1 superfamily)
MGQMVEIQLGEFRPVYKYDLNGVTCQRGDYVILEVERGSEFGRVVSDVTRECKSKVETANGKILRVATEGDLKQIENNRMKVLDAKGACVRKISDRKLPMQIVNAEYTFDSSKVIFTFTAEGRVDFRNLVKDLAKVFRVRIELKQIGVRDKAKVVGGYGVCGRELCCSSFLKGFHPLSIKMAKEQGLPLNPSRISGLCGRIKCCMAYEFSVYKELSRSLPHVGDKITTPEGKGRVSEVNILKRIVVADLGEGKMFKMQYPGLDQKEPASAGAGAS